MSTKPIRIQRQRTKGWRMPPNTVSVTRPGRYGNPFTDANSGIASPVTRFVCEVLPFLDLEPLRGKNLACWCRVGDDAMPTFCLRRRTRGRPMSHDLIDAAALRLLPSFMRLYGPTKRGEVVVAVFDVAERFVEESNKRRALRAAKRPSMPPPRDDEWHR